jgi:hypothetical protein
MFVVHVLFVTVVLKTSFATFSKVLSLSLYFHTVFYICIRNEQALFLFLSAFISKPLYLLDTFCVVVSLHAVHKMNVRRVAYLTESFNQKATRRIFTKFGKNVCNFNSLQCNYNMEDATTCEVVVALAIINIVS